MKKTRMVRSSALAAAVASAIIGSAAASVRTQPSGERSPLATEGRSIRERVDHLNLVLTGPLEVRDASGVTFLSLPAGTTVGLQRIEIEFATAGLAICQRTELRDVILSEDTVAVDRATGGNVTLPAGTLLRVRLDQGMDADGKVVRDRIDLRALRPDGILVRIRDRAPEIDVVATEHPAWGATKGRPEAEPGPPVG